MKTIPTSLIIAILMISISLNAVQEVQADISISNQDPIDDVFFSTNTSDENVTFIQTENPDIDIINVRYDRQTNSKNVTMSLTINQKGTIIDRYDFNNPGKPSNEGRSVFYLIQLVTNEHFYQVIYMNKTCKLFSDEIEYKISERTLQVEFSLDSVHEQYEYVLAAAYDVSNTTQDGYQLYIDGAPNEILLSVTVDQYLHTSYIEEPLYFNAEIYDYFNIAEPPFTFHWDFDDGTEIEQSNITTSSSQINHTYNEPGVYRVKLYFNDSAGHYAYDELLVDVNIRPPVYKLYNVNWTKTSDEIQMNRFISRKTPTYDSIYLDVSKPDILHNAEIQIKWSDDNSYGFLINKGLDTLTITLCNHTDCIIKKSNGQGTLSYQFDLFEKPKNFTIIADSVYEARQLINPLVSGMNHEQYDIKAEIEIGEKFWRILKFISDTGNDIEITVTYEYFQNSITLIEE